jgi:type VI protein secretion system component VasF
VVTVGAPILSMFVELWIVILVVAAIAAAIFIPMGFVLSREKRELAAEADDLPPDTER